MSAFKEKLAGARHSLTIWFNGLVGVLVIILPELLSSFPSLREYMPENIYQNVMVVLIVANILLRFKTVTDLRDKA